MDGDDIDADDLAAFVETQSKIEKESSKNLAAFVEEEKFASQMVSSVLMKFLSLILDTDATGESKKKVRRAPGRRDNSKLLSNMNLNEGQ